MASKVGVTHIHNLHFTYFVNHSAIIAIVEDRRKIEYRVEHSVKVLLSAH